MLCSESAKLSRVRRMKNVPDALLLATIGWPVSLVLALGLLAVALAWPLFIAAVYFEDPTLTVEVDS